MSKVDWSLAPEGATHWNRVNEFFYRFGFGRCECWSEHHQYYKPCSNLESYADEMIERPKQPQAWSGDGYPPAGTICEFNRYDGAWVRCLIKLIDSDGIVIKCSGYLGSLFAKKCSLLTFAYGNVQFRPIKTDEQIAAEKRESAIRELMDIAQVDCRVTAARLVDAGFKREVK